MYRINRGVCLLVVLLLLTCLSGCKNKPTPFAPGIPQNLTAAPVSDTEIVLSWTDQSNNETGFKIERKTGADGTYSQIATASAGNTSYHNTGLTPITTYYYRVRAYNTAGDSGYSIEVSAKTPPVNAPSNLTATAITGGQINLTWDDSSSNENGFKIERKCNAGAYTQITTVDANVNHYSDTGLLSTTYCYRIRAYNSNGNSNYSNEASAKAGNLPAAPSGFAATLVYNTQINISWNSVNNTDGYKIERKTGIGGTYVRIATTGAGTGTILFRNSQLNSETTYYYRIQAYNNIGDSEYSNEADATTGAPITNAGLANTAWPKFRGDMKNSGRSQYLGAQTNHLKWSYSTGGVISSYYQGLSQPLDSSSPAIGSDGTIYVGSTDNKLYAINSDGSLKWFFNTGASITSSPTITSDGVIYINSDITLFAINSDGSLKLSYSPGGIIKSSAVGPDGTIYIGSNSPGIYAINPNGSIKWFYGTGGGIYTTPAIDSGGTIYVSSSYEGALLYAIDSDGSLEWSYAKSGIRIGSSPVIGPDGTIYVGVSGGVCRAINTDGSLKWNYITGNAASLSPSPAIDADGTLYVGSGAADGNLYAINPDGSIKWSYTTGGAITSSPVIGSDGTVYIGSKDKKIYAINSDSSLKWSYTTGGELTSSPAIGADGTVYIGSTDGILYAFGN